MDDKSLKMFRAARRTIASIWNQSPSDNWARLMSRAPARKSRSTEPLYVWCLSTGRVGTQTLATLAGLAPDVQSVHEPEPLLFGLGRLAFEAGDLPEGETRQMAIRVLNEAVATCRSLKTIAGATYIETSPQVTFLAPILHRQFPNSRFLHVVRHPGEVVRSGMRRGWYSGHPNDRWRIEPTLSDPMAANWPRMTPFEKNVWNWSRTNLWIRDFLKSLPSPNYGTIESDRLFSGDPETVDSFFRLLQVPTPEIGDVRRVLGQVLNAQQTGSFPRQDEWTKEQRTALKSIAEELLQEYGYQL